MSADLAPLILAACIGIGALALGAMLTEWLTATSKRFSAELEAEPQSAAGARLIRAVGSTFSNLAAPFGSLTARLDQKLTYAGRPYGGVGGREYLAAAIVLSVLVALGVGAFFGLTSTLQGGSVSEALNAGLFWIVLAAPAIGLYLIFDVHSSAISNSAEIEREFPFFLDLAVLVVQAGGTPYKALGKYVEASPGTSLAKEVAITARDADATSFEEALYRMIERIEPRSVSTILKNLAQGEKSSGEAERFYRDQAEELRYLREEMANRTAERLKTNIVFPVFLMMTGIILAALAPTIVSIRAQGFF